MSNRLMTCAKVALGLGVLMWASIFVVIPLRDTAGWMATAYRYAYVLMCGAALMVVIGLLLMQIAKYNEDSYDFPEKPDPQRVAELLTWIAPQARRCISFSERPGQPLTVGFSKAYGYPDLPIGRKRPLDDNGEPLELIVQLRCSDLAPFDPENRYPHAGMLYFFDGLVLYCGQEEVLQPSCPELEWNGNPIVFGENQDFPDFSIACGQFPDIKWADYFEACRQAGWRVCDGIIGGYCHSERELAASLDHCEVLLTVFFDCPCHDGEGITYLIDPQDLSNRSFSNALCV